MLASDAHQQLINSLVSRSADQVSTTLQDEVVILNVKTGKYYNLNPVGSRIWELIEQPASVNLIVDAIMNEYNVERERCLQDISNILQSMQGAGLIDMVVGGATSTVLDT